MKGRVTVGRKDRVREIFIHGITHQMAYQLEQSQFETRNQELLIGLLMSAGAQGIGQSFAAFPSDKQGAGWKVEQDMNNS